MPIAMHHESDHTYRLEISGVLLRAEFRQCEAEPACSPGRACATVPCRTARPIPIPITISAALTTRPGVLMFKSPFAPWEEQGAYRSAWLLAGTERRSDSMV